MGAESIGWQTFLFPFLTILNLSMIGHWQTQTNSNPSEERAARICIKFIFRSP